MGSVHMHLCSSCSRSAELRHEAKRNSLDVNVSATMRGHSLVAPVSIMYIS